MGRSKLLPVLSDEEIIKKVHVIRGQSVMIDSDVAVLYGVKSRRLREQVKRNIEKFPPHFMFQLNAKEINELVKKKVIESSHHLGGYFPLAFTEHGILMLANVLTSKTATAVSIRIIEALVNMRKKTGPVQRSVIEKIEELEKKVKNNEADIEMIVAALNEIASSQPSRSQIGFKT